MVSAHLCAQDLIAFRSTSHTLRTLCLTHTATLVKQLKQVHVRERTRLAEEVQALDFAGVPLLTALRRFSKATPAPRPYMDPRSLVVPSESRYSLAQIFVLRYNRGNPGVYQGLYFWSLEKLVNLLYLLDEFVHRGTSMSISQATLDPLLLMVWRVATTVDHVQQQTEMRELGVALRSDHAMAAILLDEFLDAFRDVCQRSLWPSWHPKRSDEMVSLLQGSDVGLLSLPALDGRPDALSYCFRGQRARRVFWWLLCTRGVREVDGLVAAAVMEDLKVVCIEAAR